MTSSFWLSGVESCAFSQAEKERAPKTIAPVFWLAELVKLVYGSFGQSKMHRTLDFCPDQPARNEMYQNVHKHFSIISTSFQNLFVVDVT